MFLQLRFSDSVVIPVDALLKHSRANKNSFSVVLKAFPYNPVLCPCIMLNHYIARTKILGGSLISYLSIFIDLFSLLLVVLRVAGLRVVYEAGIDTDIFTAHSTRAASSSAARESDLPLKILKTAGWTNALSKNFMMKLFHCRGASRPL